MKQAFYLIIILLLNEKTCFGQTGKQMEMLHSGKLVSSNFAEIVPIEIWHDLILLKASINGVKGTFVWDNGFSATALSDGFAKKAKVNFGANNILGTDGNNSSMQMRLATAGTIAVGKIIIIASPVIKIDTRAFSDTNKQIDGMLGASVINLMNWDFNFDKNTTAVSDKLFNESGVVLKYRINDYNNHFMSLKINNYDFVDARVDFGSNAETWAVTVDDLGAFSNSKISQQYGFTGISVNGLSNIDTSYVINNNYTYLLAGKTFNYLPSIELSKNVNGINIGNRFFRRQNVIINSADTTYILYPRQTAIDELPVKSFGIKLLKTGDKIVIGKIIENPNLKEKKLQLMSEVIEVNGNPASYFADNFFLMDYQNNLLKKELPLIIKLKDGTTYSFSPQMDSEF